MMRVCDIEGCERKHCAKGMCGIHYRRATKKRKAETSKQWYQENKERRAETGKQWYLENKEQKAAGSQRWRANNKEQISKTGKRYRADNKERKAETDKQWYQSNRERVLEYRIQRTQEHKKRIDALKNKPCTDCGERFEPEQMDWDHIDPSTKLYNIGSMKGLKWERIEEEMTKCELVCKPCHRKRTKARLVQA